MLIEHKGKTIAIVSHGVTIRCMICYLTKIPIEHNMFFELGNTSLSIIKKSGDEEAQLQVINNITHLNENV